jgi:ATP-binding cassette subfamily B protein
VSAAPGRGERLSALRYLPAFLGLVWRTHRGYAAVIVALRLLRALIPVAMLYVARLILDEVVAGAAGAGGSADLWRYLAIEVGLAVAADLLARGSALAESLLGDLFSIRVSVRMMEHAATLDLEQYEDAKFQDHMERARQQTAGTRIALVSQLLAMAQDVVTFATLGAALLSFSPWLGALLVLAVLPSFWGETHFAGLQYSMLFRHTPERRQLNYLRSLGISEVSAKEVQIFGISGWLTDRYRTMAERFYDENRRLSTRKGVVSALLSLVGTAGYYGAYVAILLATVNGSLTVGQLTFLAGSFARSRELAQRLLLAAAELYEQTLFLRDLFVFFDTRPRISSKPGARPVPSPIREGFVFENVGFRYPGGERWAVRNVSFRLSPGECMALVGENGAGKTTITKLLARLYDPTEGRITLDGVDLREYELQSLRRAIGVIFQDFVKYDMRLDENIGVGRIDLARPSLDGGAAAEGAAPVCPEIRVAAERSLASTLLPRLPRGYRQMLGRRFDEGVGLSGGEWQKVALGRAYMRDAPLMILDEPTAALDARAECEVFERFRDLTRARMSVVISHRFSTVRMADRILVLSGGRSVEEGSHDELLVREGLYAELFDMQAAGYR